MYATSANSLKPDVRQDLILNKDTFVMLFDINAEFLVFCEDSQIRPVAAL